MNKYKIKVLMKTETIGHIEIFAENMEKAQAIELKQDEIACCFKSHYANNVSYELITNQIFILNK